MKANSPNIKKILIIAAASCLGIGIAGFLIVNAADFSHRRHAELDQAKAMLRQSFEKNRELAAQLKKMDERYFELLKELKTVNQTAHEAEERIGKQVGTLKELTKEKQTAEQGNQFVQWLKTQLGQGKPAGEAAKLPETVADYQAEIEKTSELFRQKRKAWEEQKMRLERQQRQVAAYEAREKDLHRQIELKDKQIEALKKQTSQQEIVKKENPEENKPEPEAQDKKIEQITKKSAELIKQAHDPHQQNRAAILYNLGVVYIYSGLYRDAAKMFEQALTINPKDAASHYNLAILYDDHLNDVSKALEHYNAFLGLCKDEEKQRQVLNWIQILKQGKSPRTQSRTESAKEAYNHIFLTNAS